MDNPLVSVIIPTKNSEKFFEKCLDSIKKQTYKKPSEKNNSHGASIEIIVVDNNSTDKTKEIARKYTNKVFEINDYFKTLKLDNFKTEIRPERSMQRNFGLSQAKGKYVLFVDQDMYLSKNLIKEAIELFQKNPLINSLFIPEETIAEGFWGKCKKFEREFYLIGDISAEAARFFDTNLVREMHGFDESNTGTEDWDLSDRYLSKYPNCSRTKNIIVHDEGFVSFQNLIKEKKRYANSGIKKYMKIAPQYRKIPFPFRPSVKKQYMRFFRHPILAIGTMIMKFFEGLTIFEK